MVTRNTRVHRSDRPLPYFRVQPFYDEITPLSHGRTQPGGPPYEGRSRMGQYPIEFAEVPGTANDQTISKSRGPWFHTGNYIPRADPLRWTDSGPIRPEMHFWTFSWRRRSGGTHMSRTDAGRMEGLHTMLPSPTKFTGEYLKGDNPTVMRRPRRSRLTQTRFRGQSYSQTTNMLPGGG